MPAASFQQCKTGSVLYYTLKFDKCLCCLMIEHRSRWCVSLLSNPCKLGEPSVLSFWPSTKRMNSCQAFHLFIFFSFSQFNFSLIAVAPRGCSSQYAVPGPVLVATVSWAIEQEAQKKVIQILAKSQLIVFPVFLSGVRGCLPLREIVPSPSSGNTAYIVHSALLDKSLSLTRHVQLQPVPAPASQESVTPPALHHSKSHQLPQTVCVSILKATMSLTAP